MAQERPDNSNDLFGYDPGARPPIPRPHLHGGVSSREGSSSRIPPSGPSGSGLRDTFSRSYLRARRAVTEYPVQTIASIATIFFAFGAALGRRR